jgi:hypothetical protein
LDKLMLFWHGLRPYTFQPDNHFLDTTQSHDRIVYKVGNHLKRNSVKILSISVSFKTSRLVK